VRERVRERGVKSEPNAGQFAEPIAEVKECIRIRDDGLKLENNINNSCHCKNGRWPLPLFHSLSLSLVYVSCFLPFPSSCIIPFGFENVCGRFMVFLNCQTSNIPNLDLIHSILAHGRAVALCTLRLVSEKTELSCK
jgi:hypothetical protein